MASKKSSLPSWASRVVFSGADIDKATKSVSVLQRKLKEVTHLWWQLGLQLQQNPAPLDKLKCDPGKDSVQEKFQRMLEYWLNKGKDEYRTWGALAKAVDDSGNKALGNQVRAFDRYRKHAKADVSLVDLTDLLQPLAPKWKALAINLCIPLWVSDMIDNKLSAEDCLVKVLEKWITDSNEEATFEVLYNALESHGVANRRLALTLLEDSEVLELLTVSKQVKKEKDKKSVEEELECYIAKLKPKRKDLDQAERELSEEEEEDSACGEDADEMTDANDLNQEETELTEEAEEDQCPMDVNGTKDPNEITERLLKQLSKH